MGDRDQGPGEHSGDRSAAGGSILSESPPPRAGDGNSRVASACLNITDGLKPPFGYDLCGQESQFHIYLLCLNAYRSPPPGSIISLSVEY